MQKNYLYTNIIPELELEGVPPASLTDKSASLTDKSASMATVMYMCLKNSYTNIVGSPYLHMSIIFCINLVHFITNFNN